MFKSKLFDQGEPQKAKKSVEKVVKNKINRVQDVNMAKKATGGAKIKKIKVVDKLGNLNKSKDSVLDHNLSRVSLGFGSFKEDDMLEESQIFDSQIIDAGEILQLQNDKKFTIHGPEKLSSRLSSAKNNSKFLFKDP